MKKIKIKKCLQSLKKQAYKNFEIIIVDDSTDKTVEVIKKLTKDDKRFRLVKQGEKPAGWIGKSYALQKGSKMGRGK